METSVSKKIAYCKSEAMIFFKNGIKSNTHSAREIDMSHLNHVRRAGDISGFSSHSRARLRQSLLSLDVPGSAMYGVTLTLPPDGLFAYNRPYPRTQHFKGKKTDPQKVPNQDIDEVENLNEGESFKEAGLENKPRFDFPETVHRFGVYFQRRFPKSGFIWRVELQQRGAPHLHAVVYLHADDYALGPEVKGHPSQGPRALRWVRCFDLYHYLAYLWCKAVFETAFAGSAADFEHWFDNQIWGNGLDIQPLPTTSSALRYICDHASKRKQAQLGYRGRQWGVCGRKRFFASSGERVLEEGDRRIVSALRVLRKLRRYRIAKPDAPFGSKRTPANARGAANGITFCSSETIARLRDYLEIDKPCDNPSRDSNSAKPEFSESLVASLTCDFGRFLEPLRLNDWP